MEERKEKGREEEEEGERKRGRQGWKGRKERDTKKNLQEKAEALLCNISAVF